MNQASRRHRLTARPGTPTNQQAGLAGFDLQQLALFRISQNRFDDVFALGQGAT